MNKRCNFASCWIYIGILLGARPFLHISRIRVKNRQVFLPDSVEESIYGLYDFFARNNLLNNEVWAACRRILSTSSEAN
jgi:hypothetical protein